MTRRSLSFLEDGDLHAITPAMHFVIGCFIKAMGGPHALVAWVVAAVSLFATGTRFGRSLTLTVTVALASPAPREFIPST